MYVAAAVGGVYCCCLIVSAAWLARRLNDDKEGGSLDGVELADGMSMAVSDGNSLVIESLSSYLVHAGPGSGLYVSARDVLDGTHMGSNGDSGAVNPIANSKPSIYGGMPSAPNAPTIQYSGLGVAREDGVQYESLP